MEPRIENLKSTTDPTAIEFKRGITVPFQPISDMEKSMGKNKTMWKSTVVETTAIDEFLMDWIEGSWAGGDKAHSYSRIVAKSDIRFTDPTGNLEPIPVFGSWSRLSIVPVGVGNDLWKPTKPVPTLNTGNKFLEDWVKYASSSAGSNRNYTTQREATAA